MRHGACPSVKLNHKEHVLSRMRPDAALGVNLRPKCFFFQERASDRRCIRR